MNGLTFNGVHSDTLGLVMKTVQRSAGAPVRQKEIVIPGRDGAFVFPYKKRNTKTHIARFTYTATNMTDIRQKERQIGAWLSAQEAPLIFDDEPDIAYLATAYAEIIPTEDGFARSVDIEFVCQPFGFATEEEGVERYITGAHQESIDYIGTQLIGLGSQQGSFFVVEIEGSFTDIQVSINDATISFGTALTGGKITIDNTNGTIKSGGENIIDEATFSNFFTLYPGGNLMQIDGTGLDCYVRARYKALYV